eukprot:UN2487
MSWLVQEAVRISVLPLVRAVLNYMFAVVLAKLLIRCLEIADEVVQPKLVLMSLKLGARMRPAQRARLRGPSRAGFMNRAHSGSA